MLATPQARALALVMLGIVALQVAWLTAVPSFRGIDEFDHAYRAASVARGHWEPAEETPATGHGRGQLILVPADIVAAAHDACASLDYTGHDNCNPVTPANAEGEVVVASAAGTYNPAFYYVVGTAARPFHGDDALLAMRIATAALCDLLLLAALVLAASAHRWGATGLALACTPTLLYGSVIAAPNAVGFAAALLMWFGIVALPTDPEERAPRLALAGVVAGASVVMLAHSTGPLWVGLVALCSLPLTWPRLRLLWREHRRSTITAVSVLAVCGLACVAWIAWAGTNDPRSEQPAYGSAPARIMVAGPVLWLLQSIATLRMRDQAAPLGVYAVGLVVLALIVGLALRVGDRRSRWAMGAVVVIATVVPLTLTWLAYPRVGGAWQGRYALPLSYGLLVIACACLGRRARLPWPVLAALVVCVAVVHASTMTAFVDSAPSIGAQPVGTPLLFALVGLFASALLFAGLRSIPERARA